MENFRLNKQIVYAAGMMGWSIMINLIGVMLIFYYLPPDGSGLAVLISQNRWFHIFNILAVILASGRLIDAFYDPFIARMSDKSKNKRGRRIPFMLYSVLPSAVFCILVFYPPVQGISHSNAIWLLITLTLFFIATTTYAIPYNAMLPEIARTAQDKVRLSTFQQVGFVSGIVIAAQTNVIADVFGSVFHLHDRTVSVRYAVIFLSVTGGIAMLLPALVIDEKKYCNSTPSSTPLLASLKESFSNRNFIFFIVACFSYYMAINLISNGLLYFAKVLANLSANEGGILMIFMVVLSVAFYPAVNLSVKKLGEKKIFVISLFMLAFAFFGIPLIGKLHIPPRIMLYSSVALSAFPVASLGILPNALLAGLIDDEVRRTGDNKEGMFFAVNFFSIKLGQTAGLSLFAMLTIYGKDPGNDLGLRLTGVAGAVLCIIAGITFAGFRQRANIYD